ncbi:hypothetical protein NECAME_14685 [Necator americanus]|uniref:Uncharacterized protein n=1 Tax=Necator americanus TaxID=51031 RepID=W2SLQ4_NECAM|nr:hypothetical protein NECAME_14685 [Necator americanus]ETN70555.1 hypothetical protein NECAME_14685 [Necator americanus]
MVFQMWYLTRSHKLAEKVMEDVQLPRESEISGSLNACNTPAKIRRTKWRRDIIKRRHVPLLCIVPTSMISRTATY